MKCKYLKQKINRKIYCKKKKKEIGLKECPLCSYKEYKQQKIYEIKKVSSKRAKRERTRYSVFYSNLDKCCVCGSAYQMTKHEIFEGPGKRANSMKYGFVLPLCLKCHKELQENPTFNEIWKVKAQAYFEKNYGSREVFIRLFGKNKL